MATEVQCPASEDCEFEGVPQSVHAHITASTDHKGESGVSYQREIAELLPNGEQAPWERGPKGFESDQWETVESDNGDNEETDAEVLDEQGNDGNEGGKETPEKAGSEDTETATQRVGNEGSGEETEMGGGIPIPVSTRTLVVLAIVAALGFYMYASWDDSESSTGDVDEESDGEADPMVSAGLVAT